jgi:hypothetical protein
VRLPSNGIIRWPNRLCAIRDGAHGEHEAGIYGKKDRGAFAVVVAAGGYADEDHGEVCQQKLFYVTPQSCS